MAAYKRRIYLINPKFQLKFSFYLATIIFVSSLAYPIGIYELLEQVISRLSLQNPAAASTLVDKKQTLIILLSVWQLGYMAVVFIFSIFFSHKIAGPIYKLLQYLKMAKDGKPKYELSFRKNDYFQEISTAVNETLGNIHKIHAEDFAYLKEIELYLNNLSHSLPEDKQAVLQEISNNISNMRGRYGNTEKTDS